VKKTHLFFIIIISALLQATLVNYFRFFWVKPDLLLICTVLASLAYPSGWGIALSFWAGALKDILSGTNAGMSTLIFPAYSLAIIFISKNITFDLIILRVALVFLFALLDTVISRLILVSQGNFIATGIFLRITVLGCLYTTAVSYLFFRIQERFLTPERTAPDV